VGWACCKRLQVKKRSEIPFINKSVVRPIGVSVCSRQSQLDKPGHQVQKGEQLPWGLTHNSIYTKPASCQRSTGTAYLANPQRRYSCE